MILSLDLGTTHSKGAIFTRRGDLIRHARHANETHRDHAGSAFYNPEQIWASVIQIILELIQGIDPGQISAIGISSMAETGLLVDNSSREARTNMFPWHDKIAIHQVTKIEIDQDPIQKFCRTGIRPNFKCSLAKLLWIRDNHPGWLEGSTWLSTADYIALRLTGEMATDYSLAGRTYGFRIDDLRWDAEWLETLGLPVEIFPPVYPSGYPIGKLHRESASITGLPIDTPVCISGHDHVCAAFAMVGSSSDQALDSMGTAEALIGNLGGSKLGTREYQSGLVFGRHVAGGSYYWMGGMSASGGSLDWLRGILGDPQITYRDLADLINHSSPKPTGIIYLPYLSGSGSPHTDIHVRGAFIGLDLSHDRTDLVKAVLEGTAFEAEFIRQAAGQVIGTEILALTAAGSVTQIKQWMQIKADVSGCEIIVPNVQDGTLLGAALVAGIGCGIYSSEAEARSSVTLSPASKYHPNPSQNQIYQTLYQQGYLPLQKPIREIHKKF